MNLQRSRIAAPSKAAAPARRPLLALAAITAALLGTAAQAQTWEYKSYKKQGMGGQYDKNNFVSGTISVEEKDGKTFFSMNAGSVDACLRGSIPAVVTKSDETTTVEPQIALAGCDKFRYVIRNDGSGGIREHLRGDQWVNDKFDHGLTPKK
jgi:hypothetical protein